MRKTAAILIHCHHDGIGTVPQILQDHDFDIKIYLTPKDNFKNIDPDLLIVMGGPQGVYEMDRYPYLQDEMLTIKKRLPEDRPLLGICLGAQLMAGALGAKVYKGKQGLEIGWYDITVNALGHEHPVQHFDSAQTKIMQWHGDTFDLPPGATLLASSDLYKNQAFSYGKNAAALQFHPEVDEKLSLQWISKMDEADVANSEDLACAKARLSSETKNYSDKAAQQMRLFMKDWLRQVNLL